MQLPGLLIEYLVNGALSMVWLLPVLFSLGYILYKDNISILLLLPALYVIGMMIDFISGLVVKSYKDQIKSRVKEEVGVTEGSSQSKEIKMLLYSPELAKASEMRSSRDRISRGTIVNVALATIVLPIVVFQKYGVATAISIFLAGFILEVICWNMWIRFQTLSYRYEYKAFRLLEDKLRSAQASPAKSGADVKAKDD